MAIKRVIAWKVARKMEAKRISKTTMPALMGTSRSALKRLLSPNNTLVTPHIPGDAARAVGKILPI